MSGNDIDVELLRDKPTLFYERLCNRLGADDADWVIGLTADICNHCWDEGLPCGCTRDE